MYMGQNYLLKIFCFYLGFTQQPNIFGIGCLAADHKENMYSEGQQ